MEALTQINYHGCNASYKVTTLNYVRFHAVLTDFSGTEKSSLPVQIDFAHYNHKTDIIRYLQRSITTAEVLVIANALMARLRFAETFFS